jgi:hypothetical protein
VFFRATSFESAWRVLQAMFDLSALALPWDWQPGLVSLLGSDWQFRFAHLQAFGGSRQLTWIVALLLLVWLLPNSQTLMLRLEKAAAYWRTRGVNRAYLLVGAFSVLITLLAVINGSRGYSEFIYFNF